MSIGKRIRAVRKHFKMTATDFAMEFNMSQANLSGIENNSHQPRLALLKEIYKKWNVNAGWLLTGDGDMFINRPNSQDDTEINYDLLKDTMLTIENVLYKNRLELIPEKKVELIIQAYKFCSAMDSKLTYESVNRLLKIS